MPNFAPACIARVDLVGLALADEVADRRGGDEDLAWPPRVPCRPSSCASVWQTTPCSDCGELGAHLLLLVRREDVDDAVDGLGGVLRVQGGEDEVTGLGGGQGDRDRLEVAHLTDEDDVGVLAQHVLEGVRERLGVLADLALVDQASLVAVQELDRVLDRHDVVVAAAVGQVDQRRERRRLARTGRTGDEHEAARQGGEVGHRRRDAEVLELLDLERDDAEGRADASRAGGRC